jgi:O-antigen/teichoic acid export membrane protein
MNEHLAKLFRNAAVYGFGRIVGKVISFLLIPFYTFYFSPAEYGVMEVLNLTVMVAAVLLAPGLATAVMRFYYDSDDPRERNLAISTGLAFTLLVGGCIAALVVLFPDWPAYALLGNIKYRTLIQLAGCGFFFSFSSDIGWVYLRGQQRSGLYTFLTQSSMIASVILNIYFVSIRKMGVAGVFWVNILVTAVIWAVLVAITLRQAGGRLSPTKLLGLLKFGTPLFTIWLAAYVLNYSDRFFLLRFRGIEAVGVYALGYKFAYIISLLVIQPFQLIWEPQSYEISKRQDAAGLFSQIFALYSVALISMALILSLLIPEIFGIMVDAKFSTAWRFVPLIAFGYAVQGIGLFFEAGLLIRKKNVALSMIGIASIATCLLLNLGLIWAWGAWGAAGATFASFVFLAAASWRQSVRVYPFDCNFPVLLKVLAASAALLLAGYSLPFESLVARIAVKTLLIGFFLVWLGRLPVIPPGLARSLGREATQWFRNRVSPVLNWVGAGQEAGSK